MMTIDSTLTQWSSLLLRALAYIFLRWVGELSLQSGLPGLLLTLRLIGSRSGKFTIRQPALAL
jgi:hypothetical protein